MRHSLSRRQMILAGVCSLLGTAVPAQRQFPPVPLWRPSFQPGLDLVIDRMNYYFDDQADFAVFRNGTCAIVDQGLTDAAATKMGHDILLAIYNFHPDFRPYEMDDGNILVAYNHPAYNTVISELARQHWDEVEARYLDGLATSEVIMTSSGKNSFDDFGKMALLGRCYMFMDAQAPEVVQIVRATA